MFRPRWAKASTACTYRLAPLRGRLWIFAVECGQVVESIELPMAGVRLVRPRRFQDDRGFFVEHFNPSSLERVGIRDVFVQDNLSLSRSVGTIRGLHFQSPPMAQAKLVSVITGSIIDVVVDARVGSPSYGQHVSAALDNVDGWQIYVPEGCLHGFVTRQPDTRVLYKVTAGYSPECDGSVLWNDPDLAIDWGISADQAVLSPKDASAQRFGAFKSPFNLDAFEALK